MELGDGKRIVSITIISEGQAAWRGLTTVASGYSLSNNGESC